MKGYLAGVLALCVMALASMLYKQGRANVFAGFEKVSAQAGDPTLYLYGFFSSESCAPCAELIGVLNNLPEEFRVTGIVPRAEAARIELLKEEYQIRFPVLSSARFRRYRPFVTPSIIGASRGGRILFVLPCATLGPEEIRMFLIDFQVKLAPYLANESF